MKYSFLLCIVKYGKTKFLVKLKAIYCLPNFIIETTLTNTEQTEVIFEILFRLVCNVLINRIQIRLLYKVYRGKWRRDKRT